MRSFDLNIAGYKIRFQSMDEGPDLVPASRFGGFIYPHNDPDVIIRVSSENVTVPGDAKMVFNAPYVEEINGLQLKKDDEFWSIFSHHDHLYIKTIFPHHEKKREAVLKFYLSNREWDLQLTGSLSGCDPMEYPLDGLILYYLTVIHSDILVHASGVRYNEKGFLFTGISGKGKSTMARLWSETGAEVIHDDRLIIRRNNHGYEMHNTPVYSNDMPCKSPLDRIFIIHHGPDNRMINVEGAEAVSLVTANCIQHNWDQKTITQLLDSVSCLCEKIPSSKLFFRPDRTIIDFILENE